VSKFNTVRLWLVDIRSTESSARFSKQAKTTNYRRRSSDSMLSDKFQRIARITFTAVAIVLSVPVSVAASPTSGLDYGLDLYDDKRYRNAQDALLDLMRDSAFKRLDTAQRSLVYSHIAYSMMNQGKERESIHYIDKALAQTKREFGERSLQYVSRLRAKALAHYWSNDRRKAVRIGESIIDTLERLDGDYRDELYHFRHLVSRMRKSNMKKRELPKDLSDFYTDCESISNETYLARVDSIMSKHKQIGRDIKPDYKQSQYFKNTYIAKARESSRDRKTRIIYVPDKEHMDDWCVVYPDKKQIGRVIISASNDR
jgi:hypothetical protein